MKALIPLLLLAAALAGAQPLPPDTWAGLWTRDLGAGRLVPTTAPEERTVIHTGARDWALTSGQRVPVVPGESWTLTSTAGRTGSGTAQLELVARDARGEVLDWDFALVPVAAEGPLVTAFTIPARVATVEPRWSGSGPGETRVTTLTLTKTANAPLTPAPGALVVENALLRVTVNAETGALDFTDRRTGTLWAGPGTAWSVVRARAEARQITLTLVDAHTGKPLDVGIALDDRRAEVQITVTGEGSLEAEVRYPPALVSPAGSRLVVPLNEGIAYPTDDPAIPEMRLVGYGGHGLSMAFWGLVTGPRTGLGGPGYLVLLNTPDDAVLDLRRTEGRLAAGILWQGQKGRFAYPRRLTYVFFDQARIPDLTARYRSTVEAQGNLVTLKDKETAGLDRLRGAADVWYWDKDPVGLARELKAAGMDRVLWSNQEPPAAVAAINSLGFLTGRYDIYQDAMDPAQFPKLRYLHPDWTSSAWPDGLVVDRDGRWVKGWEIETKDGGMIPCGVLTDTWAPALARERIGADLTDHPYGARFIDTTTASAWREDWSPGHPLTRTESKRSRMDLLDVVSKEFRLVTGSETGHEAAVPHLHYFEGMMSLGPYRVPDAGRNMQQRVDPAPAVITGFQVNEAYRVPLFELVYHDCVVSYWYWGDYSNKVPSVWVKRDLFNALYGTPPVYLFDRAFWNQNRDRFADSYRVATQTARKTADSALVDFRYLTDDGRVQQTVFANGVTATVNFGSQAVQTAEGPLPGLTALVR